MHRCRRSVLIITFVGGLGLAAVAAYAQGIGLGIGIPDNRAKGGGVGVAPPSCSDSLDFSDGCNSQYLVVIM